MKRNSFVLAACVAIAGTLIAFGAGAQSVKLTLGHGAAPGNPRDVAAHKFADLVKAESGGRIEVEVSPSKYIPHTGHKYEMILR